MALTEGAVLDGKYRIEKVLGRGGMGTVYAGAHTKIRRQVAIKVLKPVLCADESMVERFEREALAASAVRSPHVVEIFDVGALDSGEHFIIMERLEGESLSERLRASRQLSPAEAFAIASQLLAGLAAAHAEGIVHRDLKPANVHISATDGMVKVLDFGVSKFSELPSSDGFTETGAIVGTPHYMSPEQTKGSRHADHRSDLYSVGAILFRMLTGRLPLTAQTIHELIAKLISSEAPSIKSVAPTLDEGAATLVDRALKKDPRDRFADALEMKRAIDTWLASGGSEITHTVHTLHPEDADEPMTQMVTPRSSDVLIPRMPVPAAEAETRVDTPAPAPTLLPTQQLPASVTPSPSAFSTHDLRPPQPKRGVGVVVGVAVALVAVAATVAVMFGGGTSEPQSPAAQPAGRTSVTSTTDGSTREPAGDPEIVDLDDPVPGASASASASASADRTSKPTARPAPRRRRRAQPKAAPAPSAQPTATPDGRDYRTDI